MDKEKLFTFINNVAKDYQAVSEGSVVESIVDTNAPEELVKATSQFDKQIEELLADVTDYEVLEKIQEYAALMTNVYEKCAFQKGFEYALKLTETI